MIALTRGSAGAVLYLPEKQYAAKGPKVRVVDPIGSGDAFTAALAAGMIRGAAPEHILQVACEAGAAAVQGRGALVDLPDDLRRAFA
jgi:sugar/nucleoside kinase (ribokinase family)